MNTTDQILEGLAASLGRPVDPQLLADAYSTIHRLTTQLAVMTRTADARLAEVWELRAQLVTERADHTRAIDRANTRNNRLAARVERLKRRTADPRRGPTDDEYRRVVGRLPAEIRRRRAAANQPAPSLVDTQLLLGVLKAIDTATRAYDNTPRLAVVGQHLPERMTA